MSDASPSWASPPARRSGPPVEDRPATPRPLLAALVATLALAAAQATHVVGRDELVVGLRLFLVGVIALQVALAVGAARRSAGAALGLLACQLTTTVASLAGGFGDRRVAFAAGSIVVFALVASSLGSFPTPPLPPISSAPDGEGAR